MDKTDGIILTRSVYLFNLPTNTINQMTTNHISLNYYISL